MKWKIPVLWTVIVILLSIATHKVSGLSFWACMILVAAAGLVNGYVATIEDNWPGGFNNPDSPPSNTQLRVRQITNACCGGYSEGAADWF